MKFMKKSLRFNSLLTFTLILLSTILTPFLDTIPMAYCAEGDYLEVWSLNAANTYPRGITTDGLNIWVLDVIGDKVYKYEMNGDYVDVWDLEDPPNGNPLGIATNGSNIWVTDFGDDAVYVYNMTGGYLGFWLTKAPENTDCQGITTDGSNIWITDSGDDAVYKYEMNGDYLDIWSTKAPENADPKGITTDGSNIWITDSGDDAVYKYEMNGDYLDVWNLNVDNADPYGVATDGIEFWVTDTVDLAVYRYEGSAPAAFVSNTGIVSSDSIVINEQWFFLNASIEVRPNATTFLFNRIDIDPEGLNMSCSYTNSTDTFVEENDPNNYLELDAVTSTKTELSNTSLRIDYYILLHSNVTTTGVYNVSVYSTASGDLNDADNFTSVFTLYIVNLEARDYNKDTWEFSYELYESIVETDNAYTLEHEGVTFWYLGGTNTTFIPITEDINRINAGFIFNSMNFSRDTEIFHAYLNLTWYNTNPLTTSETITIYGIAESDPQTYVNQTDFESRALTTAYKKHVVSIAPVDNQNWITIDISNIIQELVDDYVDTCENIEIRILTSIGSFDRSVYSYETSPTKSVKLYIAHSGCSEYLPSWLTDRGGRWVFLRINYDDFPLGYIDYKGWLGTTGTGAGTSAQIGTDPGAYMNSSSAPNLLSLYSWSINSVFMIKREFNLTNCDVLGNSLQHAAYDDAKNRPVWIKVEGQTMFDTLIASPLFEWNWYSNSSIVDPEGLKDVGYGIKSVHGINGALVDSSLWLFHFTYWDEDSLGYFFDIPDYGPGDVVTFEGPMPAPRWSEEGTNNTYRNFNTEFHISWSDIVELDTCIFSTNETGSWVNHTISDFEGMESYAFYYDVLPSEQLTYFYNWYCNNTMGFWNSTGIISLEIDEFPCEFIDATLYTMVGENKYTNDGWLFMGELYQLEANIKNMTNFYLELDDGENQVTFIYNNATKYLTIKVTEQFLTGLIHAEVETVNTTLEQYLLIWRFILNRNIVDISNTTITYFGENIPARKTTSGTAITEINIYNLGGLTYYEFVGDGSRTAQGTPFELYATNGSTSSSARAEQIFRKLQSVHFLMEIDMSNEWDEGNGEYDIDAGVGYIDIGMDYRLDGSWVDGFKIRLYIQDADVGHHDIGNDHDWIEWSADFYNYDPDYDSVQNLQSQLIYSNHWGYENENLSPDHHNRTSSQLWIDLWFDRTNASTTIATQINSYYHGMKEHGSAWWFGYGKFQPMISDYDNAKFLDNLYDENGEISNCQKIELVKFWIEVGKIDIEDGNDETWVIRAIEDMNREQAIDRMMGIDEPTFVQTKVLDMPQGGFINALKTAINNLSSTIWLGALLFIKILMSSIGYLMNAIGLGLWWESFSIMLNNIATASLSFMDDLTIALLNSALLIEQITRLITNGVTRYVYVITAFITSILAWYGYIIQMFSGGGIFNIDIWTSLNLEDIFILLMHLSPVWWINRLNESDHFIETLQGDLRFIIMLVTGLFNFLASVIIVTMTLINILLGMLPI